jgi:ATP phosphoribosyltransferase regulatory subunit
MTHPIPPGTRDVLPDEMRELRALLESMRGTFEAAGYGEVLTPTVEYEEVLRLGDERAAGAGWRTFDEHGRLMVLRSDMTIPIARLAATRLAGHEGALRLCYFGHAYRSVLRGSGQLTEFLQSGAELIGVPGAEGDAEVVGLAIDALSACGLRRHRVGLGDGALYRRLLAELGIPSDQGEPLVMCLSRRDMAGLEARVRAGGLPDTLVELPALRGGPEVLDAAERLVSAEALAELRTLQRALDARGYAERVIFDLGLVHELGYYTGAVFEVYDPAVGFALGGGGRYDDLVGRFGDPRPACGIALDVQRVHMAQAAEEALA